MCSSAKRGSCGIILHILGAAVLVDVLLVTTGEFRLGQVRLGQVTIHGMNKCCESLGHIMIFLCYEFKQHSSTKQTRIVLLCRSPQWSIFLLRLKGQKKKKKKRRKILSTARGEEEKINAIYQHVLFGAIGWFQVFIKYTESELVYSFLLSRILAVFLSDFLQTL